MQLFIDLFHSRGDQAPAQDQNKVIHAEEDKAPGGAMPHAVAEPDAEQGNSSRRQGSKMVAQLFPGSAGQLLHGLRHGDGIENVIFEPGAQGDMPPGPELRNGPGEERPLEIFRHGDSEDLGRAGDGIHGTGKVHIQLDGIAYRRNGDHASLEFPVLVKNAFHEGVQPIRHHQLFHQAEENTLKSQGQVIIADLTGIPQLVRRLTVAADGALHDLGEEGQKQSHPH